MRDAPLRVHALGVHRHHAGPRVSAPGGERVDLPFCHTPLPSRTSHACARMVVLSMRRMWSGSGPPRASAARRARMKSHFAIRARWRALAGHAGAARAGRAGAMVDLARGLRAGVGQRAVGRPASGVNAGQGAEECTTVRARGCGRGGPRSDASFAVSGGTRLQSAGAAPRGAEDAAATPPADSAARPHRGRQRSPALARRRRGARARHATTLVHRFGYRVGIAQGHHPRPRRPSAFAPSTTGARQEAIRALFSVIRHVVVKRDGRREPVAFDKITARIKKLCYGFDPARVDPAVVSQKVGPRRVQRRDHPSSSTTSPPRPPRSDDAAPRLRQAGGAHRRLEPAQADVQVVLGDDAQAHAYVNPKTGEHAPLISDEIRDIITEHAERLNARDRVRPRLRVRLLRLQDARALVPAQDERQDRGAAAADADARRPRHPQARHRRGDRVLPPDVGEVVHARDADDVQRGDDAAADVVVLPPLDAGRLDRGHLRHAEALRADLEVERRRRPLGLNIRASGASGIAAPTARRTGQPMPMLRVFNNTARSMVNQGGGIRGRARSPSTSSRGTPTSSTFLDLRKNHGKEEARARDLFYALWVPDRLHAARRGERRVRVWFGAWRSARTSARALWTTLRGAPNSRRSTRSTRRRAARKTNKARSWERRLDAQIETGTRDGLRHAHAAPRTAPRRPPRGQLHLARAQSSDPFLALSQPRRTRSQPAEPRHDPRLEPVHRDHRVHVARRGRRLQPRVDRAAALRPSTAPSTTRSCTTSRTSSPSNLNRVIDNNFYPVEEARTSNMRHRPVGLGVQGLADVFFILLKLPFDSRRSARAQPRHLRDDLLRRALARRATSRRPTATTSRTRARPSRRACCSTTCGA